MMQLYYVMELRDDPFYCQYCLFSPQIYPENFNERREKRHAVNNERVSETHMYTGDWFLDAELMFYSKGIVEKSVCEYIWGKKWIVEIRLHIVLY